MEVMAREFGHRGEMMAKLHKQIDSARGFSKVMP
jgi:hypothetical protein